MRQTKRRINKALKRWVKDDRKRKFIKLYFGLSGKPAMTKKAIAEKYGISTGRVQQIIKDGLKVFEHPLARRRLRGTFSNLKIGLQ